MVGSGQANSWRHHQITHHRAFGLRIGARFGIPELARSPGGADPDLELVLTPRHELVERFSGCAETPVVYTSVLGDGRHARTEWGRAGDLMITAADRAVFYLTADRRQLHCAPADDADPGWRRFLLDSALARAALEHGFEAIHAGAFDSGEGVVAISAGEGGGKSTLLAEFLRRGMTLFTDDILMLSPGPAGPVAHPGPPLMNLPDAPTPASLGRRLASFGDEAWMAIDRPPIRAQPLAAVVLLERGVGDVIVAQRQAPTSIPLLDCSLRSGVHRFGRRFSLLADVAEVTPIYRLTAPVSASPTDLADVVIAGLEHSSESLSAVAIGAR